ncbi:hypothetical protein, partial [Pseudomonas avellanae]|uniref:hypothetical protein n=2 Tax=Pseudomonas syringae group TaxID=136849 RepID=UPI001CA5707C
TSSALSTELEQALKADSLRAKHNRRTAKALFEQIKAEGYDGGSSWPITLSFTELIFRQRHSLGLLS